MNGDTFEVVQIAKDIRQLLSLEGCLMESGVNLEIDLYMHGFFASGELPPITSSSNNKMGIHSKVIQMNDSALIPRHRIDNKKVHVTPLAKKANVVNLGEVGCGDANILKKLAQLERDIHYVELRADCPFLEAIGYVSLGMARDQSLLAQTILMLQPDIFPYLVELLKRGSFAYLHNERGAFSDIQQILERTGDVEKKLENVENKLERLEVKTSDVKNKLEQLEVKTSDVGNKVERLLQIPTAALLGAIIFGIKNIKH